MNDLLCFLLKCAQDFHDFTMQLLSIPTWNIIIIFLFSVKTAEISFNIFLLSDATIDNIVPFLKKLEDLKSIYSYKSFLTKYCLITGLLVVAVCSMQFDKLNLKTAILYSMFGPYFIRKKFYKAFEEDIGNASLKAVNDSLYEIRKNKDESDEYQKEMEKIKKDLDIFLKNIDEE